MICRRRNNPVRVVPQSGAAATATPRDAASAGPADRSLHKDGLKRVEKLLDRYVAEGRVGSASSLIYQYGEKCFEYSVGEVKEDEIFRVASMTKFVTAICIHSLVEEGALDMQEDLTAEWLPELAKVTVMGMDLRERPNRGTITMHSLLSHTSGLAYSHTGADDNDELKDVIQAVAEKYAAADMWDGLPASKEHTNDTFLARLGKCPLAFEPGTRYLYGVNYDVAAIVAQRITGKAMEEVMRERVFEPCGMTDTQFYLPEEKRSRLAVCYKVPASGKGVATPLEMPIIYYPYFTKGGFQSGGAGLTSTLQDMRRLCDGVIASARGDPPLEGKRRMLARCTTKLITEDALPPNMPRSCLPPGLGQTLGCNMITDPAKCGKAEPRGSLYFAGFFGCTGCIDVEHGISAVLSVQRFPGREGDLRHTFRAAIYSAIP